MAEKVIRKYLPQESGFSKNMAEAVNYSMLAGGKRLRPVFMYETYCMLGGNKELVEPFMAAMEMVHTTTMYTVALPRMSNLRNPGGGRTPQV